MIKRINLFIGYFCYIMAFLLTCYYLVLEFSIIDITSPLVRLRIIGIVILLMYFGCFFFIKNNNLVRDKLVKFNMIVWFSLYIIMLLNLTLFDKYFGRSGGMLYMTDTLSVRNYFETSFNIVPFETIDNYIIAFKNDNLLVSDFLYNIVGNLLAFMPFAFFLPRLFKRINKFNKFFIIVSCCILLVEFLQLLTMSGSFDVDDYILNILGASLLYGIINNSLIKKYIDKILYFQYKKMLV